MNFAIFYDTETTGLPIEDLPDAHPDQPHIVQLAACVVNLATRQTLQSMDVIIRPDGWVIPAAAAAIHGIHTEQAQALGVSEGLAIEMFFELSANLLRVAHNIAFDDYIVSNALLRHLDSVAYAAWRGDGYSRTACTMEGARSVMRLPASARMVTAGMGHLYKAPSLAQAHSYFTGQPVVNAHRAMADVQACMAVFFGLQDLQVARGELVPC